MTTTEIIDRCAQVGATVFDPKMPLTGVYRKVGFDPSQSIRMADDEFLIVSHHGYRTIGRFTGRTRRTFKLDCPTIERFEIDTIADEDGVIWGVKGAPIAGTVAVRPECKLR